MVLDMQGEGQSKQAHLFWGSASFMIAFTQVLAEPAKEARKALIELVLPTHLTETGLTEATDRAQLSGALDVAGAGWAKPRPDLRSQLPQDTSAPALEAGPAIAPCFFSLPSPAPFPSSPACTDDTLARRWRLDLF